MAVTVRKGGVGWGGVTADGGGVASRHTAPLHFIGFTNVCHMSQDGGVSPRTVRAGMAAVAAIVSSFEVRI